MRARLLGLAMAAAGMMAWPWVFDFTYNHTPDAVSDLRAAVRALLVATGVLLAFFLAPAAVWVGSSRSVTQRERSFGQGLFFACATATPLLQLGSDLAQGPWHGILGFLMKAAIANGFWFMVFGSILHARLGLLEKSNLK